MLAPLNPLGQRAVRIMVGCGIADVLQVTSIGRVLGVGRAHRIPVTLSTADPLALPPSGVISRLFVDEHSTKKAQVSCAETWADR